MNLELHGKVALVTCAGAGIGLACARELVAEGASVYALSRSGAGETREAGSGPGSLRHVAGDVTSTADLDRVLDAMPSPDVVVFVPVRERLTSLLEAEAGEFARSLDRTFFPFLHLLKRILPAMSRSRYGRVISVVGASTLAPLWNHALSNVARVAAAALGSGAARELAACGVTLNTIVLGPFDTPGLLDQWRARAELRGVGSARFASERVASIPTNRLGNPRECGALCALLASPLMGQLTGQTIRVDGGEQLGL